MDGVSMDELNGTLVRKKGKFTPRLTLGVGDMEKISYHDFFGKITITIFYHDSFSSWF